MSLPASPTATPALPQVTLWHTCFDQCTDAGLLAAYRRLLSPEELARGERFTFARDRHSHTVSRALVRTVLGHLLQQPPERLGFDANAQGKPALRSPSGVPPELQFNLSHTQGMAILATCVGQPVGVDVEATDRRAPVDIARGQFAPVEADDLARLAARGGDQALHFWSLWTLKESLIKATGLGLSTPLTRFAFALDGQDALQLHGDPATPEGRTDWWFGQWRPTPRHLAALCVARPPQWDGQTAPAVDTRLVVPLVSDVPMACHFERTVVSRWRAHGDGDGV